MKFWMRITDVPLQELVAKTSIQCPEADFFIKNYCDKPVVLRGEKVFKIKEDQI